MQTLCITCARVAALQVGNYSDIPYDVVAQVNPHHSKHAESSLNPPSPHLTRRGHLHVAELPPSSMRLPHFLEDIHPHSAAPLRPGSLTGFPK